MSSVAEFESDQREFAATIRQLRLQADMTGARLAALANMSRSKVSKLERCRIVPSELDAKVLATALNMDNVGSDQLVRLARRLAEKPPLPAARHNFIARQQLRLQAESVATRFKYCNGVLPGLVQIPEFSRRVFELLPVDLTNDEITELIVDRQRRAAILVDDRRSFSFIVHENSLVDAIASNVVMAKQVEALLSLVERPNIELHILPIGTPSSYIFEMYAIFDDAVVLCEGTISDREVSRPDEVELYSAHFQSLVATATSGESTADLLRSHLERFLEIVDLRTNPARLAEAELKRQPM